MNIALPSIQRDLDMEPSQLAWVVNAYILAFGGFLVVTGRVADRYGLVRVLVVGIVVFGGASILCGLASGGGALVAFRLIQGIGSALIAPAVLALLAMIFTDPVERVRAFGVWGAGASLGGLSDVLIFGGPRLMCSPGTQSPTLTCRQCSLP